MMKDSEIVFSRPLQCWLVHYSFWDESWQGSNYIRRVQISAVRRLG